MTNDRFASPTGQHLRHHGAGGLLRIADATAKAHWHAKDHHTHGGSLDHDHADDGTVLPRGDHDHDDGHDGEETQSPHDSKSEVRSRILEVFEAARRQDPEGWLVVRMVRNRTGLDIGHVPDLGARVAALADQGLLERRRPSGRPVFEYRLRAATAVHGGQA